MIFASGDTLAFRQSELFEIQAKQVEVELYVKVPYRECKVNKQVPPITRFCQDLVSV